MSTTFYQVAVDAPITDPLTYAKPQKDGLQIPIGSCVVVPLGKRHVLGFVVQIVDDGEPAGSFDIKSILDVFVPSPFFPPELLPLYQWIASYYHYPLGRVIKKALPVSPNVKSSLALSVSEENRDTFRHLIASEFPDISSLWFDVLLQKREVFESQLRISDRKEKRFLDKLIGEGVVRRFRKIEIAEKKKKTETAYSFSPGVLNHPGFGIDKDSGNIFFKEDKTHYGDFKPSEAKTLLLINEFLDKNPKSTVVPRKILLTLYKNASSPLLSLCQKGILDKEEVVHYRNPFAFTPREPEQYHIHKLSSEQETALAQVLPAIKKEIFTSYLLHGITGSGKTEVYLQAVEQTLTLGKTALVLVPEIALASQLESLFFDRFEDKLALLHSGLSPGERFDQWQRIRTGEATVVLGARSAIFAPLMNLGIVIVDEEHDPAYKQDEGSRYNGRDLAVVRAKQASCPVVLGSATPSVTSYYNCMTGKYKLLSMEKRVARRKLPSVTVVDLTKEKRARHDLFFSDPLISSMNKVLEKKQQVLLFVNRRGFSTSFLCTDCGHVLQCKHCNVSLTYHKATTTLLCHYCGYKLTPQTTCPTCQSTNIKGVGLGVERVEEEAEQLFPEARIARLDSDVAMKRKSYHEILQSVRQEKIDILVGTQMVAKGLDFPNITLVGIIWADASLSIPDYKASERTFSLLSQVTGRAGRGEIQGEVIIQTHQPYHYAIGCAKTHDYQQLYQHEIEIRSQTQFPPFTRIVNIKLKNKNRKLVEGAAHETVTLLESSQFAKNISLLGPSPAPLERVKNQYRWQIVIMSKELEKLHFLCDFLLSKRTEICRKGTELILDIDPENLM